ncbi:hypothetical protein HAX54_005706, partial [Datura stramonium]|nr:hypothetical protein [Datura stramonium]
SSTLLSSPMDHQPSSCSRGGCVAQRGKLYLRITFYFKLNTLSLDFFYSSGENA